MRLILSILLFLSLQSQGQIIRANPFYRPPVSGCSYLLDQYSGAAAAYSLRKLDCDYAGSAIRVRRSSDNTETDIGFTSGGDLDTAALKAFIGTGGSDDGFVVTWYDQSGNSRNITQASSTNQPLIMDNGVVLRAGSRPSVRFVDATDILKGSYSGTSTDNTMAVVFKFNRTNTYGVIMTIGNTDASCYTLLGMGVSPYNRAIYTVSTQSQDGVFTQNHEIWGSTTTTGSAKLWVNGSSQSVTNSTTTYTANLNYISLGNDNYNSTLYPNIQEAIYWSSTKSDSDIAGINTNQNTYYSVY